MTPTLALVSSSIRPRRKSAIARDGRCDRRAAVLRVHPRVRGRAVEAEVEEPTVRRAEHDLADRRALVVHEAGRRDEPRVVERVGAAQRHLLLRREEELDAGVRRPSVEDPTGRLEHDDDRGLVVRAEDRPGRVAHDPVLADDRLDRPLGRDRVRVRAEEDRRAARRSSRAGGSRCCRRRRRAAPPRRPRPTRVRARSGTSPTRSATARSFPDGLGIAQSSRKRSTNGDVSCCCADATPARYRRRRLRSIRRSHPAPGRGRFGPRPAHPRDHGPSRARSSR